MDTDIAGWILEFFLRQNALDDRLLKVLLRALPLPDDNPDLTKRLILQKLEFDIAIGTISESTLGFLEQLEELDHKQGHTEVSESMKLAYCAVAVYCTAKFVEESADDDKYKYFSAVRRIWRGRVRKMEKFDVANRVGLVSDNLLGWMDDLEAGVWVVDTYENVLAKCKRLDVLEALHQYVMEAKEKMGSSFLELVAETLSDEALMEIVGTSDHEEHPDNRTGVDDPTALHDGNEEALHVNGDDLDVGVIGDKKNEPQINLKEHKDTADTVELSNSIDCSNKRSPTRPEKPSPEKKVVSPQINNAYKKLLAPRKRKRWTNIEEDTLRTGVLKYGKGNWKLILNMYRDIFEDRTEVDLKDKWRNLMR